MRVLHASMNSAYLIILKLWAVKGPDLDRESARIHSNCSPLQPCDIIDEGGATQDTDCCGLWLLSCGTAAAALIFAETHLNCAPTL